MSIGEKIHYQVHVINKCCEVDQIAAGFCSIGFPVIWRLGEYVLNPSDELMEKRCELFQQGHILVVVGYRDEKHKIIYATDAWFCRDPEAY